ncbi:MAG: MBL fold metallo-hydrolase [Planctomycetota bacterium]|nr:MBL fold metallo-hydrolase [Planctomycetota bacterium]
MAPKINPLAFLLTLSFSALSFGAADAGVRTASFRFGGLDVHALLDFSMPAKPTQLLLGISPEDIRRYVPTDEVELQVTAFVVTMGGKTILFDTGCGPGAGGQLQACLRADGFSADDIDAVAITHMHFDHVGGLLAPDGAAAFPHAEILIARDEYEWWLAPGRENDAPASQRGMVAEAAASVQPYAGKIRLFSYNEEILPGLVALAAPGHTWGHAVYRLQAGGGVLFIVGDLTHIAPVQMPRPEAAIVFDSDPIMAVETRKAYFARAARENLPVAGMHLPFPGVGRISSAGDGFAFSATVHE